MVDFEKTYRELLNINPKLQHVEKKVFVEFYHQLHEDETIEYGAGCQFTGERDGILVLTNTRLIFVGKGTLWGTTIQEFQFDNIQSIKFSTGVLDHQLTIDIQGEQKEFVATFQRKPLKRIYELIQTTLKEAKNKAAVAPNTSAAPSTQKDDLISQLERLGALKEKGILSEDEFQQQKQKILAQL